MIAFWQGPSSVRLCDPGPKCVMRSFTSGIQLQSWHRTYLYVSKFKYLSDQKKGSAATRNVVAIEVASTIRKSLLATASCYLAINHEELSVFNKSG